ncbi:MAG: hypothetical protein UT03_C0024G0009 [Candidatus Moranbacteria bacterium GW2011_GWD2_38_7]|nr:MAG: hypothetical protein US82_C0028G0022 [Parcubacteria group bacterium GW2011_GWC1_38_22]KKQ80447.1 MAG: hypothetical protein UT03_C0024G0009 [Candidatus Moranbacteria bacterium GW2011_GWD2_38_7]
MNRENETNPGFRNQVRNDKEVLKEKGYEEKSLGSAFMWVWKIIELVLCFVEFLEKFNEPK